MGSDFHFHGILLFNYASKADNCLTSHPHAIKGYYNAVPFSVFM